MVKVWNVETAEEIRSFKGAQSVAFSPNSKRLASGCDGGVRIWEMMIKHDAIVSKLPQSAVGSIVVFGPDGKSLATANDDKTIRLWDVAAGRELRIFKDTPGKSLAWRLARMGNAWLPPALLQVHECPGAR
jgi:WD40 repeat protein